MDVLGIGAIIEDLDTYDLDKYMKKTDNNDIKFVFNGAENYMRAFTRQLQA